MVNDHTGCEFISFIRVITSIAVYNDQYVSIDKFLPFQKQVAEMYHFSRSKKIWAKKQMMFLNWNPGNRVLLILTQN